MIANTPEPPYWAVIFSSLRTPRRRGLWRHGGGDGGPGGQATGYLGFESARDSGLGLAVSYWSDLESIAAWRAHLAHAPAQAKGRERWYEAYGVRIARVERAYGWTRDEG